MIKQNGIFGNCGISADLRKAGVVHFVAFLGFVVGIQIYLLTYIDIIVYLYIRGGVNVDDYSGCGSERSKE